MALVNSQSLAGSEEATVPEYRSKERVVRNEVLVYAEGDLIPETDTEELERQGFTEKAKSAGSDKSRKSTSNK